MTHFYLHCTHYIVPKRLLNHPNSFCGGMFKLHTKYDADSLLYLLTHFECDGHTVHVFAQQPLPHPLTSTVKSSLFTPVHSSPLFVAARLHQCHSNLSHYISNDHFPDGPSTLGFFWTDLVHTHIFNFTMLCILCYFPVI